MNKILIELYVPMIEKKYDVFIPTNRKLNRVLVLLKKVVNDLSDGTYPLDYESVLCEYQSGKMYELDKTAKELNIRNGSKIIFL